MLNFLLKMKTIERISETRAVIKQTSSREPSESIVLEAGPDQS